MHQLDAVSAQRDDAAAAEQVQRVFVHERRCAAKMLAPHRLPGPDTAMPGGEAHEQPPSVDPACVGEVGVGVFGARFEGAVDATGGAVGGHRQVGAMPLLPGAEQCDRQQRQRAGLPADVLEHLIDELGLDLHPGTPGRLSYHPAQLVLV